MQKTQEAIIRDLLCHRMIGFKTFQGDFTFYNTDLTREQVIEKMSHVKAAYPFRTKMGIYHRIAAFVTAGQTSFQKVTGKPWEIFLKENFFALRLACRIRWRLLLICPNH